ncbi:5'-nucleotidase C-terminal domain-containing protein [Echinimonas agarilytica]|uniref:5'-nucleotidase C-terminal domain-containing protein n=1 Tax=Echinimonas agarilytica TaxID=1215918 RepID=A0AA41W6T9_9GAMM|nr:5'-nucleotidase C-terminal domain-containing protein [Echinimonas agarilytica]MCM2679772.1 5'-nucleotidase C-terminal domain-containing protein [Echinimonas agarilytica]
MKHYKKILVSAILCATLVACNSSNNNNGKAISLSILHMNDHHSHINADDFDYDVSALSLSDKLEDGSNISEVSVTYGGFPMMKTLFDNLAATATNPIKIHSGDAMTGTVYYSLFKGEADAAVMNDICFDVFALGNHEFDDGDAGLARFLDFLNRGSCNTPVLAANVVPHAQSPIANDYIQPYKLMEFEGEQVGIIGIDIADKTKNSSQPDAETEFLNEIETSQKYIDELEAMGVNKIILVTHYQYKNDLLLAQSLTGVDVIVGGDSHSLLVPNYPVASSSDMSGEAPKNLTDIGFNAVGSYPSIETNLNGETVCIVQAWEYAHLMGMLQVDFDENGVVTHCSGSPQMPLDTTFVYEYSDDENRVLSTGDSQRVVAELEQLSEPVFVEPAASTQTLIDGFNEQVAVLEQTVIGEVSEDLCLDRWPGQARSTICDASATYEHGSDISNIVAKAFLTVTPTADIAIQNGGGVRVDVATGEYTIADAFTLLPFSNTLVTLNMTGAEIITVIEDALSNTLDDEGSTGSYPYASGLRFHVNASEIEGQRVSQVEVNSRLMGDWIAIDTSATYTVVTNDFIASGRDGYDTFGVIYNDSKFVDTYTEYAEGFIKYMTQLSENNQTQAKLPKDEYSTQGYIGTNGCDHSAQTDCEGF